ncbi:two-component regulator propeller domain-containing protein [Lutibacter oricola]|nr:two-component regulator propeller domain-containing protein [Lutibacter oricola]
MLKLKIVVLFLFFASHCFSQNSVRFDHLLTEDGLSQNDVNTIYQDKKGFMWFGTHDGLNKYNGYEFEIFKPDPNNPNSISSNLIYTIVGDKDDNLWIGTTGDGLNFYNQSTNKFTHYKHDSNNPHSISHDQINSIYRDRSNRLWISTLEGIDMLDLNNLTSPVKFHHVKISEDYPYKNGKKLNVSTFYEDTNGQLWMGEINGTGKMIKSKEGDFIYESANPYFKLTPVVAVRSICEDSHGRLILGTTGGLFLIKQNNGIVTRHLISTGVFNKLVSYKNQIWAGSIKGLSSFQTLGEKENLLMKNKFTYDPNNSKYSLAKSSVKSLFVDRTGIIWVGSNGGGVNILDPNRKQFKYFGKTVAPTSLSSSNIKLIFEDSNGAMWFGTEEGGLNVVSKKDNDGTYTNFKKLLGEKSPICVVEIETNNKKELLFGTANWSGLFRVDITNPNLTNTIVAENINEIGRSVFSILKDSSKNLWFGTYNGGLYRWLKSGDNQYKKDILFDKPNDTSSLPSSIIRDIIQDKKGDIWFATSEGLAFLTKEESLKKNPKFVVYQNIPGDKTSLSHNYILNIFESSTGDIWIGTFGGGLNKFVPSNNSKGHFKVYSIKQGLPNDVIKSIIEDDQGALWLSTNGGLSKFTIENEKFKNYDINDGLQSNEFGEKVSFKRDNGELYFGGVNGFNIFTADNIKDNTDKPETVFTNLLIFNEQVEIGEKINGRVILEKSINEIDEVKLKYQENSFSFEFAGLHFAAPSKNHYAYKLEGFNKDWIYTTSDKRFATYTNLEPGSYTLKVKSSNNDGLWNEEPAELKIEIIPPFWRTNWANALYLLMFLGSLMLFRRFTIIKSTKKHQLELEHIEKEKHEEIHRLKLEFFTNISHEFRTPLTLIKGPLEYLQNLDIKLPEVVVEQHKLMHKNTDYLLRLVNQLLDFRKMDKGKMDLKVGEGDIVDFVRVVGEPFQFLSHKKDVKFEINSDKEVINSWFDQDAVEKILNNLLSNAFKFAPKLGEVTINVNDGVNFKIPKGIKELPNKEDYFIIQVKDSGPGIPKHRLNFIFERFYVDRDVRKINSEGSGIGLAFTKKLVELHKGSIDVVTEENKGTMFVVWLPKNKEAYENVSGISFVHENESKTFINQVNAESHAISVLDEIVDQNFSKKKSKLPIVLVVDDNADIRALLKRGLEGIYEIYEAENGERAFEFAKKLLPNIILTDVLMPIMDGIVLCDLLKTTQETSHIPVIMLTAKISQESEMEGLKNGADAYIRKPFDLEMVKLKMQNLLKHREELRKKFNREITLQPNEVTVTSTDEIFLQKAIEIVEENMMNDEFSVEILVKGMSLSRSTFYLKIKELTGLSSGEFIRNIRLKRAMQLLDKSNLSVKEIMYMTGFNTASYFSKCFKKQFGVIPSKYVREMKDKNNGGEIPNNDLKE